MIMQYPGEFRPLNLMMLPFDERTCLYNNELMLADNMDSSGKAIDLTSDSETAPFMASPYPFKIEFYMGLVCLEGSMKVSLNLSEYRLGRGDVLVVQPGDIGRNIEISSDCMIIVIAFSDKNFVKDADPGGAMLAMRFLSYNSLLHLPDEDLKETADIYRRMRKRVQQPDYIYKRELLVSYMHVLFCNCCQFMTSGTTGGEVEARNRNTQIFNTFLDLLKEYHTAERAITFYADRLCITPKYLSQVIYRASGRHAGEWIRDYVILEAKALLRIRQYSIQQISDMLNFANQSFFGVYFKKATGFSPSEYRNL